MLRYLLLTDFANSSVDHIFSQQIGPALSPALYEQPCKELDSFWSKAVPDKLEAGRGLPSRDFKSLYNPRESKGSTSAAHRIVKLCADHQLSCFLQFGYCLL